MQPARKSYATGHHALMLLLVAVLGFSGCTRDPGKRKSEFVASAEKYVAAGKYGEAVIQYRNALKIDPNSSPLYYSLGETYTRNHQYPEGFVSFKKSAELDPTNTQARLALAKFYLIAKQYDQSIAELSELATKEPDAVEVQMLLADAYAGKGDVNRGIKVLEALLVHHSDSVPALLNLGVFYLSQNREAEAHAEFQKAIAADPKSVEARKAMAADAIRRGQTEEAETQFRAAVEANPQSDAAQRALADFYLGKGRAADAEAAFKRLAELDKSSPSGQFALASFDFSQNRYADARQIDSKLAKDSPKFLPARLQLVEIALAQADIGQASELVTQLLKERPNEPQALILRARISLEKKDPTKAISDLETAQRQEPNSPMLHYEMGTAYGQQGNMERAQASFQHALELNQNFVLADLALGQLMFSRGQWDDALKYAGPVLRRNPAEPRALLLAGNSEASLKNYPAAHQLFADYVKAYPDSPLGPLRLGYLALSQRQYAEAENQFQRSLQINPKQYDAIAGLVAMRLDQKQGEKAVQLVQEHLQSDETPVLYNMLASVYVAQLQYSQAEAALKRSLELDPQNFATHSELGEVYQREHSLDRALAEYDAALKINGKNAGLWTFYGMLNEAAGHADAAEKAYLKALQFDPGSVGAANNLAWMYCEQGRELDKALELAQRAKAAVPEAAAVSDTLGWIYYKRQLFTSAVPLFQQALKQQPSHAVYHYHLAATLLKEGKKEQARAELASALKLDSSLRNRTDIKALMGELSL